MMANLIPDPSSYAMAEVALSRSNAVRSVSFNGEHDLLQKTSPTADRPPTADAREAALLLSFTNIAEKEIRSMGSPARLWDDDDEDDDIQEELPKLPIFGGALSTSTSFCSMKKKPTKWFPLVQPRLASPMEEESTTTTSSTEGGLSDSSSYTGGEDNIIDSSSSSSPRLRSVSIDSPVLSPAPTKVLATLNPSTAPNLVTPLTTPVLIRAQHLPPLRKTRLRSGQQAQKAKRERRSSNNGKKAAAAAACTTATKMAPTTTSVEVTSTAAAADDNKKRSLKAVVVPKGKVVKTILRKKFSWKNYPELEAFLIANREEYLRHSALNYTVQQKQYNNRLTERLLELAGEHGYVFDDVEFSFVTVRDRIRCYFKSYVQSAKKRGIVVGYAAKKQGLFSTDELEKSACKKGKIVG